MKKYRERIKNFIAVFIILVMIVAFILIFRDTLTEVFRTAWDMTVGELETPCTPDDRFLYLQKHPGEIKLAFIGNWAQGNDCGMPRQKCLKQAIQEINQTGGINGRKIIPVWMDSMLSSDHLLSYIENVAYDPSFFAVIGPGTSGQLLSVKPLILNYRLLTIAPGITDPEAYSKEEPPYIFLPNPSDDQNVQEIIRWIKKKNRDNFILISENMTFASGYAKYLERMFYENNITLCTRSFFNPEYNIRFFLDELKNYFLYFKAQNAIILNYSKTNETSEQLIKWMLSHASGDIFSIKPFIGPYTSEEQKRMFTLVYWDRKDGRNVCLSK